MYLFLKKKKILATVCLVSPSQLSVASFLFSYPDFCEQFESIYICVDIKNDQVRGVSDFLEKKFSCSGKEGTNATDRRRKKSRLHGSMTGERAHPDAEGFVDAACGINVCDEHNDLP